MGKDTFDFGEAIKLLKEGKDVSREGRSGASIRLQKPDQHSKMRKPYIYINPGDGSLCPRVASHTDMLSDDWYLVE